MDFNVFLTYQALLLEPKVGPKRGPNRILDADAFGRPLESLLERSWRLLEPKKVVGVALGPSWSDLTAEKHPKKNPPRTNGAPIPTAFKPPPLGGKPPNILSLCV